MSTRRGAQHASNIMSALSEAQRPMTAYDLLDHLRPTGVAAPLTVYRALEKLVASGQVHRIESLNAYMACSAEDHHGHAHGTPPEGTSSPLFVGFTICERCGAVAEFAGSPPTPWLSEAFGETNFQPRTAAIEVRGLCANCRAN